MKTTIAILAAAMGAAISLTPAHAATPPVSHQVRVAHGDLNLTTVDGQAELQERLDRAAWQACNRVHDRRTRNILRQHHSCVRLARERVAVQVAKVIADQAMGA